VVDRETRDQSVIADFRATNGRMSDGRPILLLTVTGRKSSRPILKPLVYLPDGDRLLIFASKGGAPTHPDWYLNLVANPVVTVEVGDERYQARATPLTGAERDRLYARQVSAMPNFGEYQARTTRVIPVVALERVT
jgi:deazaflavin-dependent oxidoreductase (nitroreductase family)